MTTNYDCIMCFIIDKKGWLFILSIMTKWQTGKSNSNKKGILLVPIGINIVFGLDCNALMHRQEYLQN